MQITESQALDIQAHARAEYPREACGVIDVRGRYRALKNVHPMPETHFRIDQSQLEGLDYKAVVHSHPDGVDSPSAADMSAQQAGGVPWVIVKVTAQGCKPPFVFGSTPSALLGREFRHGVHDCYSLIQDWFQEQNQRHLTPEMPRDWLWWMKGESLYMDYYERAGWTRTTTPDVGCLGFIQSAGSPVINHAGVLINDGWFLHHLVGRLSARERAEVWIPSIKFWIQHPDFTFTGY